VTSRVQANDSVKNAIVKFVAKEYHASGETPSIGDIVLGVGTNRAKFYQVFPGGIGEVCRLAKVPTPEERIAKVRAAQVSRDLVLEDSGNSQLLNEIRVWTKPQEEQNPKARYENELASHGKFVEDLSYSARMDSDRLFEYIQNRLSKINRSLWYKINLIRSAKRNLQTIVAEAFGDYTYLDFQKRAMDVGDDEESVPTFDEWIDRTLKIWFDGAVFEGEFSDSGPGIKPDECLTCRNTLTFEAFLQDNPTVLCDNCNIYVEFGCPVCERGQMVFSQPDLLRCSSCGYPQKFAKPLWHVINPNYVLWAYARSYKDSRLKNGGIAMVRMLPDGTERVIPETFIPIGQYIYEGKKPFWAQGRSLPP